MAGGQLTLKEPSFIKFDKVTPPIIKLISYYAHKDYLIVTPDKYYIYNKYSKDILSNELHQRFLEKDEVPSDLQKIKYVKYYDEAALHQASIRALDTTQYDIFNRNRIQLIQNCTNRSQIADLCSQVNSGAQQAQLTQQAQTQAQPQQFAQPQQHFPQPPQQFAQPPQQFAQPPQHFPQPPQQFAQPPQQFATQHVPTQKLVYKSYGNGFGEFYWTTPEGTAVLAAPAPKLQFP